MCASGERSCASEWAEEVLHARLEGLLGVAQVKGRSLEAWAESWAVDGGENLERRKQRNMRTLGKRTT